MAKEIIAILGGGISGITCGSLLKEKGYTVDIYEKQDKPGGLIKCSIEKNDVLFHRVGGHVFNTKSKKVNDWFWSKFDKDKEFLQATRNASVYLNGKFLNYPIENNIYNLDLEKSEKIIDDLLQIAKSNDGLNETKSQNHLSFGGFLRQTFGETLFKLYFEPYNKKIWKTNLDNIPLDWLSGKLPMPKIDEILKTNILRKNEKKMVHSSFFYPARNGSQFIIDRLSRDLNIITSCQGLKATYNSKGIWSLNQQQYDKIIFTGDIRTLMTTFVFPDSDLRNNLLAKISSLRSNSTSNILCECDANPYSWVYLPEEKFHAHRIIMTGNFSPNNNGILRHINRITCTVEFSGIYHVDDMKKEIAKLPFNLSYLSHNIEKSSYILHDGSTKETIDSVKNFSAMYNIFLSGRFAEWKYYNMDTAIEAAMALTEEEF